MTVPEPIADIEGDGGRHYFDYFVRPAHVRPTTRLLMRVWFDPSLPRPGRPRIPHRAFNFGPLTGDCRAQLEAAAREDG